MNWTNKCSFTDIPWHQIVYYNHNLSIPDDERMNFPEWGCSSHDHWNGWNREVSEMYFTTSEIMAFCEFIRSSEVSLPITFRLWRKQRNSFTRSAIIPEEASIEASYVFDLCHEGEYDTNKAHWKLLKSGTAYTFVQNSKSKKRKR